MRLRTHGGDRERGIGLVALLLVAILVPSAGVLWFMNEAITTQSAAARQSILEAHRGQLRLVRGRLDAHWTTYEARLIENGEPASHFARLILDEAAEGVVVLSPDGGLAYPQAVSDNRVTAADRQLLAVQQLAPGDSRRQARIDRLAARLNDYTLAMPSAQRLFLMGELRTLAPNVKLPTEAALRLSTQVIEAGTPSTSPGRFEPTAIRDVWALASDDRRVIGLYRTGRLEAMVHDALHQVAPEGIRFIAFPPGDAGDAEAIAAGPWLPGWQLSFQPLDPTPFDDAARRRVLSYVWIGFACIAVMTIAGALVVRAFRREMRLARLKTDLVAVVSHEVRTPLTSMRVLVDGLLSDPTLEPAKTREYLQLVAAENERLSRLIENFLTFSRLERNRHQFVLAPARPSAIVHAAVEAIRERVPATCALRVEVSPDLPLLMADADALVTALVNLIDNALKYTPADKRVRVRTYPEGESVVFAVEDNGIGIPVREQKRIFRRFYRIDQSLARETSGVGLGLSIVDLIVRAHGGTITVRSESGAGSTFTLRLPCVAEGAAA
jgi:signal transduction histidine kinase